MHHLKCLAIGDGAVGKTCMLAVYKTNSFPGEYIPTVFDHYVANVMINEIPTQATLWDTPGQEDYERLRPLLYPGTNVLVVCFSVVNRDSFQNVITKWYPEIREHCPDIPIILVGTKVDLRDDKATLQDLLKKKQKPVATSEGWSLARKIKAESYMECSAINNEGVNEVFKEAFQRVVCPVANMQQKRKFCCFI